MADYDAKNISEHRLARIYYQIFYTGFLNPHMIYKNEYCHIKFLEQIITCCHSEALVCIQYELAS